MARRLNEVELAEIRALREAGVPFRNLAERYGVSVGVLHKHAKKQQWGDGSDGNAMANRLARERVHGIDHPELSKTRFDAISAAADSKVEVLRRQQADWLAHREAYTPELFLARTVVDDAGQPDEDKTKRAEYARFHQLKCAKISAEMLSIRHAGERKAFGISDDEAPKPENGLAGLSDEELERIVNGG